MINVRNIRRIIIFAVLFVVALSISGVLWPLVEIEYSQEEIAQNNKELSISFLEYQEDGLTFDTEHTYSFYYDGYKTEVFFTGVIHNSTDEEIDTAFLTFGFDLDSRVHTVKKEFYDLEVGENVFVEYSIGIFYRRFSYTSIDVDFTVFYELEGSSVPQYCNTYIDPQNPPSHHNSTMSGFASFVSVVSGVMAVLLVITIISAVKNRFLTEHVSETFFGEETDKKSSKRAETEEENKKTIKGEPVATCKYCGGEFFKMHTKCPDCGARLFKNSKSKE